MLFGNQKRRSAELKSCALDALSAGIMIVDADLNVVFVNEALMSLLRDAEADIKVRLPAFSAAGVVGKSLDIFHKNPSQLRQQLRGLAVSHRETLEIGDRLFDLMVTPFRAGSGPAGGFSIEWFDANVRLQNLALAAQVAAASRSQAVIEFDMKARSSRRTKTSSRRWDISSRKSAGGITGCSSIRERRTRCLQGVLGRPAAWRIQGG